MYSSVPPGNQGGGSIIDFRFESFQVFREIAGRPKVAKDFSLERLLFEMLLQPHQYSGIFGGVLQGAILSLLAHGVQSSATTDYPSMASAINRIISNQT